jgi:hypothetical protein
MPMPVLFQCDRYSGGLRLTADACATRWRKAKGAAVFDSCYPCRGCSTGATNAGEVQAAPQAPGTLCVRCGRIGQRMIHSQGLCRSCYNREREIARGADRRGHPPKRPAQVPTLGIMVGGAPVRRQAAGVVELALWALARAPGGVVCRLAPQRMAVQLPLFPGRAEAMPRRRVRRARIDYMPPVQLTLLTAEACSVG